MTLAEEKYERFLHSSYGAVIFSLVAVAGMFLASDVVRPMPLFGNHGIVFPSINLWLPSALYPWADYIAIAGQVVLAAILVAVNHFYKIRAHHPLRLPRCFCGFRACCLHWQHRFTADCLLE